MGRILHFLTCRGHGGDALCALALARAQRQLGFDARIAITTSDQTSLFLERAVDAGVPAEELRSVPHETRPLVQRLKGFGPRVRAIRSAVARHAPDVLHCHTNKASYAIDDIPAVRASSTGVRVVKCCYSSIDTFYARRFWPTCSASFDQIIVPSEHARSFQLAAGVPGARVSVIPEGIDLGAWAAADRSATRRQFGFFDDDVVVLFMARLERGKEPLAALDAFRHAQPRFPRARILVVGTGSLEVDCRKFARDNGIESLVTFAGYRMDVPNVTRAADIYVFPSRDESFGVTLLEAMAAGLPIIAADAAPIACEVVSRACGLFFRPGDVPHLASLLERLLADESLRRKLGRASAARAALFDIRIVAERYARLYDGLLRRNGFGPLVRGSPLVSASALT